MNQQKTAVFRCHDADACVMGQKACPTPSICGCEVAACAVKEGGHKPAESMHQIQDPAAAEQAAWHAGLDEGRAQAAQPFSVSNAETPQAAPAAVAVPDGREEFEEWATLEGYEGFERAMRGTGHYHSIQLEQLWQSWTNSRAALAATQAAAPAMPKWIDDPHDIEQGQMLNPEWVKSQETAAAPVVLPEPVGAIAWNRDGARPTFHAGCRDKELLRARLNEGLSGGPYRTEFAFTEQQLRALLATATGLPAQAVEMPDFDLRTSKGGRGFVAWYFANVLQRYDYENYITNKLAADFACDLAKALSSTLAAPQAQADARDAEQEVLMEHSGCGSNTQVDMLTVRLNPGDKVVMHKGRITQGFDRANRAAIAAARGK